MSGGIQGRIGQANEPTSPSRPPAPANNPRTRRQPPLAVGGSRSPIRLLGGRRRDGVVFGRGCRLIRAVPRTYGVGRDGGWGCGLARNRPWWTIPPQNGGRSYSHKRTSIHVHAFALKIPSAELTSSTGYIRGSVSHAVRFVSLIGGTGGPTANGNHPNGSHEG